MDALRVLFWVVQACRLRQCQLALSAVDLTRNTICYPSALVKTAADFAQPIDPRFTPILNGLIAEASAKATPRYARFLGMLVFAFVRFSKN